MINFIAFYVVSLLNNSLINMWKDFLKIFLAIVLSDS